MFSSWIQLKYHSLLTLNNNQEILFWNQSENSLMIDCVSVALYQMRSMVFFWWNDRWLRRYQINGLVPAYEFILWFPQVKGSCFLVLDLQMQLNHFLFLLLLIIKIITAWNKTTYLISLNCLCTICIKYNDSLFPFFFFYLKSGSCHSAIIIQNQKSSNSSYWEKSNKMKFNHIDFNVTFDRRNKQKLNYSTFEPIFSKFVVRIWVT